MRDLEEHHRSITALTRVAHWIRELASVSSLSHRAAVSEEQHLDSDCESCVKGDNHDQKDAGSLSIGRRDDWVAGAVSAADLIRKRQYRLTSS